MLRALLGLILGALLLAAVAVAYGKMKDMPAADFEPVLLVALALGAVLGAVLGFLGRRRR
jgi:hypothetical protein